MVSAGHHPRVPVGTHHATYRSAICRWTAASTTWRQSSTRLWPHSATRCTVTSGSASALLNRRGSSLANTSRFFCCAASDITPRPRSPIWPNGCRSATTRPSSWSTGCLLVVWWSDMRIHPMAVESSSDSAQSDVRHLPILPSCTVTSFVSSRRHWWTHFRIYSSIRESTSTLIPDQREYQTDEPNSLGCARRAFVRLGRGHDLRSAR